ncbi:fimbrial protein [Acinetobacter guillouiae]|uniref:fimbrial protein n=1 Tax=Acinetobacter guillouiae TaxID=106649 RepID=UPI003AF95F13
MKKLTLATLSTLALSLTCTSVFAVDGTIIVNGVVIDGTCTLIGGSNILTGLKNLTLNMPTIPKSKFKPTDPPAEAFTVFLANTTGRACDLVTSKALKGIHLSAISPTDLDATDKTLLVNKAIGASTKNPVFIRILTAYSAEVVDLSAPWGVQAKSPVYSNIGYAIYYRAQYVSKTGIVDPQTYTAKINYTLHYN